MDFIAQPDDEFRLGDFLTQSLDNKDWTNFRAAVAFVHRSGTKHVRGALAKFSKRASVRLSAGIDSGGSSAEGLQDLIASVGATGQLWLFHNANRSTFHPKIYLFKNATAADVLIGSGNLTEGGLYTNYEASVRLKLDLARPEHQTLLTSVEVALDRWSTPLPGVCFALDDALLKWLISSGKVPTEAQAREAEVGFATAKSGDSMFKALRVRAAPKASDSSDGPKPSAGAVSPAARTSNAKPVTSTRSVRVAGATSAVSTRTFLMTLQNTDVGYGQVTSGTSRRSPEIFIPIGAVDADQTFWRWPDLYVVDKAWSLKHAAWIAKKKRKSHRVARPREKMDRRNVRVKIAGKRTPIEVTIWYNPIKVDLRIRDEQLRAAGHVGDILVFKAAPARAAYDYDFDVVPPTDTRFFALNAACNVRVAANSRKRYGYI